MSITRREALAAAVGCGLTTTAAAGADDKPAAKGPAWHDPVYSHVPPAVLAVFEGTFPNHRCIRMAIRGEKDAAVYRATVFAPASTRVHTQQVGEEIVTQLRGDAGPRQVNRARTGLTHTLGGNTATVLVSLFGRG